jgi:retron-type reverse transcriptase
MFDQIISLENLFFAWKEFKRGKRRKKDVQGFERHLEDNVFSLHIDLSSNNYRHGPYQRFHIFDPKHRVIHKATVRDRLVHHAVYRVLYPIFDHSFIFDSYSCRIAKGTHAAVDRLEKFTRNVSDNYRGQCWILKFDIKKFFDSVDHEILLRILKRKIDCERTFVLVKEIISSFSKQHTVGGGSLFEVRQPIGLPIGNLTSQLFANVYLDAFDHFIKEEFRIPYYIRYTDDVVIVDSDKSKLFSFIPVIEQWLWQERRLTLHPKKIEICKLNQGIDFLGYVTLPYYRVLRARIKRRMLMRLNVTNVDSYLGLLKHCSGHKLSIRVRSLFFLQVCEAIRALLFLL